MRILIITLSLSSAIGSSTAMQWTSRDFDDRRDCFRMAAEVMQDAHRPLSERNSAIERATKIIDELIRQCSTNFYASPCFAGFAFGGLDTCGTSCIGKIYGKLGDIRRALADYRERINPAATAAASERIHELEEQVRILQRRLAEIARERERRLS